MLLTAEKIKSIYPKIKYRATDGGLYFLKQKYPHCMEVEGDKNAVYLDTGGRIADDFCIIKIEDEVLYRQVPSTKEWAVAMNLIIEED
ncbi:MAG TPA: hypothetical protein ENI76_07955 [Ignavibacteria bacterium]|nr:hypothetical protein [Ignavibacteria bacterium]